MAKKAAAVASVDDLLDSVSKSDKSKKKDGVYKVEVTSEKMLEKLRSWKKNKSAEQTAKAEREAVEGDISEFAVDELIKNIEETGKHQASIALVFEVDVEGTPVRSEINITANKNQWSTVSIENIPALKEIFGEDFDAYFLKDRTININTEELASDEGKAFIQDILAKVCGGDVSKFKRFIAVTDVYKVKPALGEAQYIDKALTKKIRKAKDDGLISQYKPAFTNK